MNMIVRWDGSLLDPRIRINDQAKSIFSDCGRKGMFTKYPRYRWLVLKSQNTIKDIDQ